MAWCTLKSLNKKEKKDVIHVELLVNIQIFWDGEGRLRTGKMETWMYVVNSLVSARA